MHLHLLSSDLSLQCKARAQMDTVWQSVAELMLATVYAALLALLCSCFMKLQRRSLH